MAGRRPVGDARRARRERSRPRALRDRRRALDRGRRPRAKRAARERLLRLGIAAGDVVSWQLPNWIEGLDRSPSPSTASARSRIRSCRSSARREVGFIVRQAQTRALVVPGVYRASTHRELAQAVRRDAPDLEHVLVARAEPPAGQARFSDVENGPVERELPPSPFGPHDVFSLFYTSGTTSEPKRRHAHTASSLGRLHRDAAALRRSRGGASTSRS